MISYYDEFIVDTHVLFEAENKFHNVSSTEIYYQVGKETTDLNFKLALICYIMSKRCLKYFKNFKHLKKVCVKQRKVGDIGGLIITIESFMNQDAIQCHIQRFLFHILVIIKCHTLFIYVCLCV